MQEKSWFGYCARFFALLFLASVAHWKQVCRGYAEMRVFPFGKVVIQSVRPAELSTCRTVVQGMIVEIFDDHSLGATFSMAQIEGQKASFSGWRYPKPLRHILGRTSVTKVLLRPAFPFSLNTREVSKIYAVLALLHHVTDKTDTAMWR
ncbi:hypothetical protein DNF23_55390 [Pseudomonas syringae pv. pisi]